jgi:hypothetical protein
MGASAFGPLAGHFADRTVVTYDPRGAERSKRTDGAPESTLASHQCPIPAGFADQPVPNPADFGLPAEDDGSRDDPLAGQNMISCNYYQHDFDALRAASTRVVVGVGTESAEMLPGRAGLAVAERLQAD